VAGGYELVANKGKLTDLIIGDTSNYIDAANAFDKLKG